MNFEKKNNTIACHCNKLSLAGPDRPQQLRSRQHDYPGREPERVGDERHPPADVDPAGGFVWHLEGLGQAARLRGRHLEHRLAEQHVGQPVGLQRARERRTGPRHPLEPELVPAGRPPRRRVDVSGA